MHEITLFIYDLLHSAVYTSRVEGDSRITGCAIACLVSNPLLPCECRVVPWFKSNVSLKSVSSKRDDKLGL